MRTIRRSLVLTGIVTVFGLSFGVKTTSAQIVTYGTTPAYTYSYALTYRYTYPFQYGYAHSSTTYYQRSYVVPGTYGYSYPQTYNYGGSAYQRYRSAVDAGADPNWPARRGLRLFKPWLY